MECVQQSAHIKTNCYFLCFNIRFVCISLALEMDKMDQVI